MFSLRPFVSADRFSNWPVAHHDEQKASLIFKINVFLCLDNELLDQICMSFIKSRQRAGVVFPESVKWVDQSLCLFLQDSIGLLLDAVRTSNEDLAQTWKKSEQWATIEQLCSKSPPHTPTPVYLPDLSLCTSEVKLCQKSLLWFLDFWS